MAQTTDELLTRVKRKAWRPSSGDSLSDTEILAIADEELQARVVPQVRAASEGYWLAETSIALVAGQQKYRIPSRASVGSIYELERVETSSTMVRPMSQVDRALRYSLGMGNSVQGTPYAYFIEDGSIVLYPTPNASAVAACSLKLRYERRPSSLVATSACARVTAVGSNTLTTTGGSWSASQNVDVVRSSSLFELLVDTQTATYSAGTFTFSGVDLTGISVGDYVCLAEQTCIVPVPDVWYWLLVDYTAAEFLRETDDVDGAAQIVAEIDAKLPKMLEMVDQRTSTFRPPIVNLSSPLHSANPYFRGWR